LRTKQAAAFRTDCSTAATW